jgi:hypothetical protein
MARKWSNLNLLGALHFVTGNCINRFPVFIEPECCRAFLDQLKALNQREMRTSDWFKYLDLNDDFEE